MSASSNELATAGERQTTLATKALPPEQQKSPSYPQRVHTKERGPLNELLRGWEKKIAQAKQKFDLLPKDHPERTQYERTYGQMLGARDQIAYAIQRMPVEVGDLYEEDKHRLDEAIRVLERLFKKW